MSGPAPGPATEPAAESRTAGLVRYLLIGAAFGFLLTKGEAISWFRIQEMFRFQSFHMYGLIGSAVVVAGISVRLIRRLGLRTIDGGEIRIQPKESRGLNTRYWLGGGMFGLGWGLTGACPGPIYTLIGAGATVYVVVLASALAGTWAYAATQRWLPHY